MFDDLDISSEMTSNLVLSEGKRDKYKRKQKPKELCQICKCNHVSGWHFGARSCAACCAFFRRCIVNERSYECLENEQLCSVEAEKNLHGCQACKKCRVDRCLAAGMRASAVESKEQKQIKPYTKKRSKSPQIEPAPQLVPQQLPSFNYSPANTTYTSSMETEISLYMLPSTSSISSPSSVFLHQIKSESSSVSQESTQLGFLPSTYRDLNENNYKKILSVLPEMKPELIKFQNWIGRIDDPSMMLSNSEQFPLLNAMFLIMRQALSWREHLLEYPSEPFGTSNAPRYYSYSLHRKVVMTEYIVMKQVVDAFYAFKEFSAEAKQTIVMNSYNYWLPFNMSVLTALYGDGSTKTCYMHRIMHFDTNFDSLISWVQSDYEVRLNNDSNCQLIASICTIPSSYNALPFHMCLKTALYGDGSVKKIYTHRIMHFDVDMDSLVNLVKSDKEKFSAPESDCQISARHLHKFLTGHVPMLVSALRYMKLNDYEMAAVYLLILIETNKSVAPMDTHAQHTLNLVREQLLKELYEFYEDDDKWRLGEILLLLCSIMETGNDFLESITLMDVCKRKIVYFALRNNNDE